METYAACYNKSLKFLRLKDSTGVQYECYNKCPEELPFNVEWPYVKYDLSTTEKENSHRCVADCPEGQFPLEGSLSCTNVSDCMEFAVQNITVGSKTI